MTQEFDIDQLLDGTLDDLADLPEFKPFPSGAYKLTIHLEQKKVNDHPSIEVKLKMIEVIELNSADEVAPSAGAETTVLYMLDNEMGQGSFKKLMSAAAAHYGAKTNRELIAELNGNQVAAVITQRPNKDKTKLYNDIAEIQVM